MVRWPLPVYGANITNLSLQSPPKNSFETAPAFPQPELAVLVSRPVGDSVTPLSPVHVGPGGTDGDALELGDVDALGEILWLGDTDAEGDCEAEGETDPLSLGDGLEDGDVDALGDCDALGLTEPLGDTEGDAEADGD